jgi:DNA-binding GntR family transcriptional regulator
MGGGRRATIDGNVAESDVAGETDRALVDRLATTIQSRVLAGEIPTGTRLRQVALADEFGVSRTPVREALRKLQASGLVEVVPHRGAVVRVPVASEIREAYEVRAELEGLAAELAAKRFEESQIRRLYEAEELFRRSVGTLIARRDRSGNAAPSSTDLADWMHANDAFHQAVHEAAGNERLRRTIAELHRSMPRNLTSIVLSESTRLLRENVDEHGAVLAAIEAGTPADARRLMVEHVQHAGALVTLRFELAAARAQVSPSG